MSYSLGISQAIQKYPLQICNQLSRSVQSVINQACQLKNRTSEYIGNLIATQFFFPLRTSAKAEMWKEDKDYYHKFWYGSERDFTLSSHEKIRQVFDTPKNEKFIISLGNKKVTLTCSLIQTKEKCSKCYNFILVPGNHSSIESTVVSLYPYLNSFLQTGKKIQGRFFIISAYNIEDKNRKSYSPKTLNEAGFILQQAIEKISKDYGVIHQFVGHSLGGILFGASLKHFDNNLTHFPKKILLDRAPSSIYEASKRIRFKCIPGTVIHSLASRVGWTLNLEEEINTFFCRVPYFGSQSLEKDTFVVSGAINDQRFSGTANLCNSSKIKQLTQITVLKFNWPDQRVPLEAHHSTFVENCTGNFLKEGDKGFLKVDENLAYRIMENSLKLMRPNEGKRE